MAARKKKRRGVAGLPEQHLESARRYAKSAEDGFRRLTAERMATTPRTAFDRFVRAERNLAAAHAECSWTLRDETLRNRCSTALRAAQDAADEARVSFAWSAKPRKKVRR